MVLQFENMRLTSLTLIVLLSLTVRDVGFEEGIWMGIWEGIGGYREWCRLRYRTHI